MSTYPFNHPMVLRKKEEKPKVQPIEIYFLARVKCPDCDFYDDVVLNRDAEVYHECNQGNVRGELPKITVPQEMLKALHKAKTINNLEYLEEMNESHKVYK